MATCNFSNRTIWTGDNLEIMRGMNSGCIDLIYLDPPFNSKANYAAPIGSKAAGAAFKDTWTLRDVDAEWINLIEAKHPALYRVILAAMTDSDKSYLAYMAVRLLEMKRILKETGSIYLHCDPTMSHHLKLMMDSIYSGGEGGLRNEIIWNRSTASGGKAGGKKFVPSHDTILYYVLNQKSFIHHRQYIPYTEKYIQQRFKYTDKEGRKYRLQVGDRRQYLDKSKGKPVSDIWTDIFPINPMAKEKVGYPTQKPLSLLRRIVEASSNTDDMILDPFCGCATTCVAAEELNRQWTGIDISDKAAELVEARTQKELGAIFQGVHRTDLPQRTDIGKPPPYNCAENRKRLYGEQGGDCNGCGTHFEGRHLEVDHIISRGKGGTDHIGNLQLLCGSCNRIKGDRGMEYLRAKLQL